jgi:hypothetical protein
MKNNSAIVLILLSVGLFYTFSNGQYKDVQEIQVVANEYRSVLRSASDVVQLRDNLMLSYNTFPIEEIDRLNKILPDHIDTVELALDLDTMASAHGISIKSVQTTINEGGSDGLIVLPENAGIYDKATISITFVSNHENFMNLLADIERSLRIMDVKQVSFVANESGLYEYNVSADMYWLK